ncbi:MAG TPA: SgcJ/EcaC family oxidoreductase [Herpetosiphonaceae bacterium]
MTDQPGAPLGGADEAEIEGLYRELLAAWNRRDAAAFAGGFAEDASVVGFDGSQMNGRAEIASTIAAIFADHQTAAYVWLVREIRQLAPGGALLRGVCGMVPPGQADLNPAANAIQSLVAVRGDGGWRIALFHNTPAQLHGRPELAAQLTDELRQALPANDSR